MGLTLERRARLSGEMISASFQVTANDEVAVSLPSSLSMVEHPAPNRSEFNLVPLRKGQFLISPLVPSDSCGHFGDPRIAPSAHGGKGFFLLERLHTARGTSASS